MLSYVVSCVCMHERTSTTPLFLEGTYHVFFLPTRLLGLLPKYIILEKNTTHVHVLSGVYPTYNWLIPSGKLT